jgi:Tfp pilus assembly protein PilO
MMKQLLQLREQLGWQGTTGLFLLALVAAFQMLALKPLEEETAFIHKKVDAARSKAAKQGRNFGSMDKQKELGEFFESLPAEKDVTDILAMIAAVADASRLELKQAEYQLVDKNKQRLEYRMVFPVQGEYANIRYFVFRVLSDHPAIALDQMNFRRDKVNDAMLKAEFKFTLFLKPTK